MTNEIHTHELCTEDHSEVHLDGLQDPSWLGLPHCVACGEPVLEAGARVRFIEDTTGEDGRGREYEIPAGTTGKVIKRINSAAMYVKVLGRSTVAWTNEIEVTR